MVYLKVEPGRTPIYEVTNSSGFLLKHLFSLKINKLKLMLTNTIQQTLN